MESCWYSQVGSVNISPYSAFNTYPTTPGFSYGSIGGVSLGTTQNNPGLKPELSKELEIGADLGFLNNRINLNATYYNSHTTNQTLSIATTPASGYNNALINVGEVQNSGYEFKMDLQVLTKSKKKTG
ncbi:TonB-dependent receptor domain-containing protein [Pedobacter sp. NJ-S-72]